MKMMGLNNWMHWMAWFTKCFIFLIASVAMMSALLKVNIIYYACNFTPQKQNFCTLCIIFLKYSY